MLKAPSSLYWNRVEAGRVLIKKIKVFLMMLLKSQSLLFWILKNRCGVLGATPVHLSLLTIAMKKN